REAMTKFFDVPVPARGVWYRLAPGDAGYGTVTDAVTLSSLLRETTAAGPFTVLPVTQRDGLSVVGVRGSGTGNMPAKAVVTVWVTATGATLPVEYDATDGRVSLTTTFSHWGQKGQVARPSNVKPAPEQGSSSGSVADALMSA